MSEYGSEKRSVLQRYLEGFDPLCPPVGMDPRDFDTPDCPACLGEHTIACVATSAANVVTFHCEYGGGIAVDLVDFIDVLLAYDPEHTSG